MTAYLNIFEWKYYSLAALLFIILFSLAINRATFITKSFLLSTAIWLAPLYYITFIIFQNATNFPVILALITESCILITWLRILWVLMNRLAAVEQSDLAILSSWLNKSILIQAAATGYFAMQPNFGIFSDGSRIEYLEGSRLNIYITYISALAAGAAAPVAAAVINIRKKWDKRAVAYMILVLLGSLLSGSKGIGVLILIAVLCYVRIPDIKIYRKIVLAPVLIAVLFSLATVIVVGSYLKLEPNDMADLMLNRIFLANDGRALAIDLSDQLHSPNISLFQESFRAYFSAVGFPPLNGPLGHLLYQLAFSSDTVNGANTSATALMIAYGSGMEKMAFFLVLMVVVFSVYMFSQGGGKYSILRLSVAVILLSLLSQDLLAFQVTLHLIILITLLLFVFKRLLPRSARQDHRGEINEAGIRL